jgi:hypothetical protein
VKNAFRKGIGYLDPAEVRRIAGTIEGDAGDALADAAESAADEARRNERGDVPDAGRTR